MSKTTDFSGGVYRTLRPFLLELSRILDHSVQSAIADFEQRGRPIDPWHMASHVRNEAKGMLGELRGTVLECEVENLANNGLLVCIWDFAIRVMKSDDGSLPSSTSRPALGKYYRQMPLFEAPVIHQLVALWPFDLQSRSLGSMSLVLPDEWAVAIEPPETVVTGVATLAEAPDNVELGDYQIVDPTEHADDERNEGKEGASESTDGEGKD